MRFFRIGSQNIMEEVFREEKLAQQVKRKNSQAYQLIQSQQSWLH
jgi:hypothetical protein